MKNTFRVLGLLLSLVAGQAMAASVDLQVTTYTYTDDPTPITNGASTTFSLIIEQNSAATAAASTLTVALPSNVTYVSNSSGCSFSSPNLTCPVPSLAQAASTTVTYVASGNTAGAISTTAAIAAGAGDTDTNSGNDNLAKTVTVISGADLTVTNVGPGGCTNSCTSTAGSTINYTLTAANAGPDAASGFRVVYDLPALVDFTYQSVSATGWSCSHSGTTLTCNYTGPSVASGATASDIVVTGQIITSAGSITTGSSISSTDVNTGDPDLSNDGPTLRVVSVTAGTNLQANSTLVSDSTGLTTLLTGDAATLTLSATNSGTQQATGVTLTDTVPSDFTIGALPGSCSAIGQAVTCTVGTVNAGATSSSFAIPLTVTASGGTSGSNTVNVSRTAPAAGSNSPNTTNYNVVTPFSNLSITKSKSAAVDVSPGGNDPVQTGQIINNTVVVTNDTSSTSDVTGTVTVVETFANTNETFNALSATSTTAGWSCTDSGLTVTCTFPITGSLARGDSLPTLSFTTNAVGANVSLSNEVCTGGTISSHVPPDDDTVADCSGNRTIYSASADTDIGLTKAVDDANIDDTETSFTYTIVVTNHSGTDTAPTVNITDAIPMFYDSSAGTTGVTPVLVGQSGGESCSGTSTVSCTIENLGPGASRTITIQVDRPVYDGSHTNTVNWDSSDTIQTTNVEADSASIGISIDPIADVAVTNISDAPDPIQVGVAMTYTTSIRNFGPSTADSVVLRHTFDDAIMAYQTGTASLTGSGGTCSFVSSFVGAPHAGLSGIECSGFSMTDGQSRQLTFDVMPTFSYWDVNPLGPYNTDASITTTTTESSSANNTSTNVANVTTEDLDLAVTKVEATGYDPDGAGPLPSRTYDPVAFGDQIKYLVTFRNNGPSLATRVVATDIVTPPAGQTSTFVSAIVDSGSSNYSPTNGVSCSVTGGSTPGTNGSPEELTCYLSAGVGDITNSILPTGQFVTLELTFNTGGATPANSVSYSTTSTLRSAETGVNPYSGDTLPISNEVTINTTVLPSTDLYVTKAVDAGADGDNSPYNINELFNYTITVGNIGTSDATGIQVTDSLPSGFIATGNATVTAGSNVSLSTNTCNGSAWTGTCDLGPLPVDGTGSDTTRQVVITIPVRATTAYTGPVGSNVTNTASIAPLPNTSIDTNASNDSDSVDVQINKSSIAGVVFADNNDDGLQTAGEDGIPSVTLTLTGTDVYGNTISETATTSGTGTYLFDALPVSDGTGYTITETHPATYIDGKENAAGTVVPNSNSTDLISTIALPANTALTGYLFGELGTSSTVAILSGYSYNDGSDDGVRDPSNPGVENVTITLTGTDTNGAVNVATTTAADGSYSFPNLLPGNYTLTQTQPTGYDDHIDTVGQINASDEGVLGNDIISNITVLAGDIGTEYNFADSNTAITGFVYVDANNDGVKDGSEAVIEGVTLTLSGNDTNNNPVNQTTTTDAAGAYSFTGMLASDASGYTVTESHPSAWVDGKDTAGNVGGSTATNDQISGIIITSSTRASDYNFGELGASLSGIVYNDNNDDGQQDPSEPGITAVTITLTGTDLNGNPVSFTTVTGDNGQYRFTNLPLPNGTGYTITETQPAGIADGKENTSNVIAGVQITNPTVEATGFNFGEIVPAAQTASVSGKVHDRDDPSITYAGWTVEIVKNGVVIATTITDANSDYLFEGLTPGTGYSIRFRHPESNAIFGVIENVSLTANTVLPDQNLPLDPSGVVYDSVTRLPVPGAIVTFSGPPGYDPAVDLIGGTANSSQIVGADGFYKFLLNPTAPSGVYSLSVTQPAGYLPPNSVNIPAPCATTLVVGGVPAPAAIQPQDTAPQGSAPFHDPASCPAIGTAGTQYYLSFNLSPASADVINNHIPLDPTGQVSGLTVVKSTSKTNVIRGELVPYSIRVTNNLATPITNIRIRDQIPAGFKYVANSATLDGTRSEPQIDVRELTWPAQDYAVDEFHEVKMLLVVGAGVGEGEYTNQAWGVNGLTNATATSIATATVRIIPDPTFDCSDLIGKVFDDKNLNGYQDKGEKGLPGIRVVTARGLNITTDSHGRYHVPCAAIPDEMHGSNFIMKLDEQTLPSGYRITTENPRVIRLTRGKLAKLNFGAAIHRVVRLDLNAKAFDQDSDELREGYNKRMQKLVDVLSTKPSVLRIAYATDGESKLQVMQRLINVRNYLSSIWGDCECHHELIIEEEVLWGADATQGSASAGRAK